MADEHDKKETAAAPVHIATMLKVVIKVRKDFLPTEYPL